MQVVFCGGILRAGLNFRADLNWGVGWNVHSRMCCGAWSSPKYISGWEYAAILERALVSPGYGSELDLKGVLVNFMCQLG